MNRRIALPKALWPLPLLLFTALAITTIVTQSASSSSSGLAYPPPATSKPGIVYPPPETSPTPSQLPPQASDAARRALERIAERDKIPGEDLVIQSDHPVDFPSLGRQFQAVTLVDTRANGKIYKLLVDSATGQVDEDISTVFEAESQAYQARYGKLDPRLYQRLLELGNNDTVTVMVWMASQPQTSFVGQQQAVFEALAAKYPQARAAMQKSGNPLDVEDRNLARKMKAEYLSLLADGMKARTSPLVTELEKRNFDVSTFDGMPALIMTVPKLVVLEISHRADVATIYLAEDKPTPALENAIPSDRAPAVWNRGITGSGELIGIIESGRINPNGSYVYLTATRNLSGAISNHTSKVAACAASYYAPYKGIAPGAHVLSVNHNSTPADVLDAVAWAINQGADVLSTSDVWSNDLNLTWSDRAFDYLARYYRITITAAAGNSVGTPNVVSPGKGWNVISVGGYDDDFDDNWSNDSMYNDSSYVNPPAGDIHNDREKPEVVAPAVSIDAWVNYQKDTSSGTSLAAPQVAGLSALLQNRDGELSTWPVAQKAIIMASATHNIIGPSIIPRYQGYAYEDLKDGAGGINADLADQVAQTRGYDPSDCYTSCWWADSFTDSGFPDGSEKHYTFYVSEPSLIRVAIAWWANVDTPNSYYSSSWLATDLDLRINDPDGEEVVQAASLSWDNNYEIGEFFARQTGQYTIRISKSLVYGAINESQNDLGTALVMIPMPNSIYVPLVMK